MQIYSIASIDYQPNIPNENSYIQTNAQIEKVNSIIQTLQVLFASLPPVPGLGGDIFLPDPLTGIENAINGTQEGKGSQGPTNPGNNEGKSNGSNEDKESKGGKGGKGTLV